MSGIQKSLLAGFVATVVVTGSVTAIAQVEEDDPPPPTAEPQAQSIDSGVAEQVGVLRQPRSADDALPADVAAFLSRIRREGENPSLSRKAVERGRYAVYLVPGNDAVCFALIDPTGGASQSCRTESSLRSGAGGPASLMSGCQDTLDSSSAPPKCTGAMFFDVVPDGVDSVTIEFASGKQSSLRSRTMPTSSTLTWMDVLSRFPTGRHPAS